MSAHGRGATRGRLLQRAVPGRARLSARTVEGGLAVAGGLIAGYLSWVYVSGGRAICAGIGQCEVVQASSYSRFMGVPVAVLGLVTYLAVLGLVWLRGRLSGQQAELALLAQFVLLFVGVAFSAWLTYVELFVIYAICPWCVTSAVIITLLFLVTVRDLVRASAQA
ncbi:MAG TPA: vitamin K epoxide reductase [Chloroflexi bacterium]|nr:vitamin K epoxide reductase [Chloroflexota bacterium]